MARRTFVEDLERAVAYHGHLCGGQILGTRISRIALDYFDIEKPEGYRDLIAFVEADRCVADAVSSITCCHIGRRRLKFHDLGKMAASFYDMGSDKAIRIASMSAVRPADADDPVEFYNRFSDGELFSIWEVKVNLDEYDLPGRPKKSVRCALCGEKVMDNRDVEVEGQTLCKVCAGEDSYYSVIQQIAL